jgi:uncharacterized surface protein with fasciclin (FAS1) repeats
MHASLRRHTAAALGAALLATSSLVIVTAPSLAQDASVTVGGAPMLRSKNIVENAANSKDHTTLVAAVKAAGLVTRSLARAPTPSLRPPTPLSTSCRRARSRRW